MRVKTFLMISSHLRWDLHLMFDPTVHGRWDTILQDRA